jgi:hypothetical protein
LTNLANRQETGNEEWTIAASPLQGSVEDNDGNNQGRNNGSIACGLVLIFVLNPQWLKGEGFLHNMDGCTGWNWEHCYDILLRAHDLASQGRSEVHTSNHGMEVSREAGFFLHGVGGFLSFFHSNPFS